MNIHISDGFETATWLFVIGAVLRMASESLSNAFFGAAASTQVSPWSAHAAIAQISILMMLLAVALFVAAFCRHKA